VSGSAQGYSIAGSLTRYYFLLVEVLETLSTLPVPSRKEVEMPVYEYRCEDCGEVFEQLVFHEAEPVRCPACAGRVQRLMSTFHVDVPDEVCGKLPKGEGRELCTECQQGGGSCPLSA
jgi:putative FmdB family regulatory protein